ncbi:MAG: oligosaccharide flippase family protein [Arcobacteraceae bacterium]|jgi:O-antigen/teichoic acid export membrane protein|nr:oligosaccharide flippase family protein [Arcobacteraceae bacterium]
MKNNTPSRKKAFLTQATGGYILTAIAMIKGLFLLPIYFKFISYELYGYWVTIGSIVTLISVINFGISTMTMQRISKSYAEKDFQAIGDYFINSNIIYILISLVFLFLAYICSYWLQDLLNVSDENLILLNQVYWIAVATMVFSFFATSFRGFSQALLQPLVGVYIMVFSNVFGICLVVFLLYSDIGLLSIAISLFITELLIVILCGLYVCVLYKRLIITSSIKKTILKEYISFSPHLFGYTIGNNILNNSHPIIITTILGAELTTAYDVTRKVIDIVLSMLNVFNSSLLGPFSHLVGEGNKEKIKQITLKIIIGSFLVGLLGYSIYMASNHTFVSLWIGEDIVLEQHVIMALGFSALAFSMTRLSRSILFGLNEIQYATNIVFIEGVGYFLLAVLLTNFIGVIGVPIAFFSISFCVAIRLINRICKIVDIKIENIVVIKLSIMIALILSYLEISYKIFSQVSWLFFIFNIIASFIVVLGLMKILKPKYFNIKMFYEILLRRRNAR